MLRAAKAIKDDEAFIHDVAVKYGQIVSNVSHMFWFRCAIANQLRQDVKKYAHLPEVQSST